MMGYTRLWGSGVAIVTMMALAACSSDEAPLPCPSIVVVQDAAQQIKFADGGRDLTDVIYQADISAAGITCEYDENAIDVDMRVRVQARRGPADESNVADIEYFVAIARWDLNVLAREAFDVKLSLPANGAKVESVDEVTPRIPLAPGRNGASYRIYVGLQLSPEELDYNREDL